MSTTTPPRALVDLHGRSPWTILPGLCLGFFMIMIDMTIVNIAVPTLVSTFHTGITAVGWVNSAYLLTFAVPLLLAGRLGDRLGRKNVFLFGMVVFTAASLWCGLSTSAMMLIIARAVQGLGAAAMTPQTMAFITNLFPPAKRGAPMGAWGAVAGVATIAGPLLGGLLVDNFGWQWIFMVNVPIGIIGLVLAVILVPGRQQRHQHRFDLVGTALSSLGLLGVVFGLQNGQRYDWGRVFGPITVPEIIGAGVLLLIAFVISQWRNRAEPLMPLSLFAHRNFSAASIAGMAIGFAMIGMFLPMTIYMQSVLGFSALKAGLVMAPSSVVSMFLAPVAGKLSNRIGGKFILMGGLTLYAIGMLWLCSSPRSGRAGPRSSPLSSSPGSASAACSRRWPPRRPATCRPDWPAPRPA